MYLVPLFLCCCISFVCLILLLTNTMGLSMLLSGVLSLGTLVPLLVCSKLAPSSTPDALVSRYNGLVSS